MEELAIPLAVLGIVAIVWLYARFIKPVWQTPALPVAPSQKALQEAHRCQLHMARVLDQQLHDEFIAGVLPAEMKVEMRRLVKETYYNG